MLTGMQIRAALALLGMSYRDLAALTGMSKNTVEAIANAENEDARGYAKTWRAIQRTLEAHGVEFIEPGEPLPPGGPGVRMRKGEPQ